jgi:hypothetical protein
LPDSRFFEFEKLRAEFERKLVQIRRSHPHPDVEALKQDIKDLKAEMKQVKDDLKGKADK